MADTETAKETRQSAVQFMTTEHFALQTANNEMKVSNNKILITGGVGGIGPGLAERRLFEKLHKKGTKKIRQLYLRRIYGRDQSKLQGCFRSKSCRLQG